MFWGSASDAMKRRRLFILIGFVRMALSLLFMALAVTLREYYLAPMTTSRPWLLRPTEAVHGHWRRGRHRGRPEEVEQVDAGDDEDDDYQAVDEERQRAMRVLAGVAEHLS